MLWGPSPTTWRGQDPSETLPGCYWPLLTGWWVNLCSPKDYPNGFPTVCVPWLSLPCYYRGLYHLDSVSVKGLRGSWAYSTFYTLKWEGMWFQQAWFQQTLLFKRCWSHTRISFHQNQNPCGSHISRNQLLKSNCWLDSCSGQEVAKWHACSSQPKKAKQTE